MKSLKCCAQNELIVKQPQLQRLYATVAVLAVCQAQEVKQSTGTMQSMKCFDEVLEWLTDVQHSGRK